MNSKYAFKAIFHCCSLANLPVIFFKVTSHAPLRRTSKPDKDVARLHDSFGLFGVFFSSFAEKKSVLAGTSIHICFGGV